ncbi:MAG: SGNH/GDSL hydrolase family protein [Verrucomicrobiales bacterium]|nr:SGNH/GDSL hydrolase family protein [Verrucomicrobiales bacterium]
MHSRRHFSKLTLGASVSLALNSLASAADPKKDTKKDELTWHQVEDWGIEGRGWQADEMDRFYARLPAKAKAVVPKSVWSLSQHSSGMLTRFETDARKIQVRYTLTGGLAMPHMPATGVSGIDLYAKNSQGQLRWVSVVKPNKKEMNATIVSGMDVGTREYTAYLPLYNGINSLEFGVPEGSTFKPIAPRKKLPLLFYGTSITHGACASRPGMTHSAILGRHLDLPIINLGFSGAGKMEIELATLLAEVDSSVYILDCLPNMTPDLVKERAEPFVRQLRKLRPDTPILMVEDRTYGYAWIKKSARQRHQDSRAGYVRAYDSLVSSGIKNIHYLAGANLLGDDNEGTTDGSHPNDLGFMRQASVMEPVLRKILKKG